MFVDAFYTPNRKKRDYCRIAIYIWIIYLYIKQTPREECCFQLAQQPRTAKPTLVHPPSLQTWPLGSPSVKLVALPTIQSKVAVSLLSLLNEC